VPGRNIYFITALAQKAYQLGGRHIAMGVNIMDYSGYPDCRPEFLEAMRDALTVGVFNNVGLGMHAPLMYLDKQAIVRLGMVLGVHYEDTHSCYNGIKGGCGECDSCILRRRAFEQIGTVDPSIDKWIKS
jgi:7-cyano-7-deazaguanine synthase